jgi:GAF domain-containing protein
VVGDALATERAPDPVACTIELPAGPGDRPTGHARLLAAIGGLSRRESLPELLREIVESACALVGARYAALAVRGPDGGLAEFVTFGLPEDVARRIGGPPGARGLLHYLTQQTGPLRLADLTRHPAAAGFPEGHPEMRAFLGTPLCVQGRPFGHVCVTEKLAGGPFSAEDEQLLVALAAAAALAVANAQLRVTSERRRRWLEGSTAITGLLLAGEDDPLPLIVDLAREVAGADLATIALPLHDDPEKLAIAAAAGQGAELCAGLIFPRASSLTGRALDAGEDLRVAEIAGQTYLSSGVPLGPALVVRLRTPHRRDLAQHGALSLVRAQGGRPFTDEELTMAAGFAAQVGIALQIRDAQHNARLLDVLHEQERIAEQLHEGVVRELFGTALALQSLAGRTGDAAVREELSEQVLRVEGTIRSIRRSLYEPVEPGAADWRQQVFDLAARFGGALGGVPEVVLTGVSADLPARAAAAVMDGMTSVLGTVSRSPSAAAARIALTRIADAIEVEVSVDVAGAEPLLQLARVVQPLTSGSAGRDGDRVRVRWAVGLSEGG